MKVEEEGFYVIRSPYETLQVDYLIPAVELPSTIKLVVAGPYEEYEQARDAMGKVLQDNAPVSGSELRRPTAYWVIKANDSYNVQSFPIGTEPENAVEGPFTDASSNPAYQQAQKAMTALLESK